MRVCDANIKNQGDVSLPLCSVLMPFSVNHVSGGQMTGSGWLPRQAKMLLLSLSVV